MIRGDPSGGADLARLTGLAALDADFAAPAFGPGEAVPTEPPPQRLEQISHNAA